MPLVAFVLAVYALPVHAAPPVVSLGAVLTRVADGTAPFVAIDPNASNGDVATLDSTSYTFDVNVNTLDAQTHTVSGLTIVSTLTSVSPDVGWILNSLPSACATKTLSVDGKTMTCVISGTYATGTALNVSAAWWGQAGVPDNTAVTASFVVSATMVPDASLGENPTPTTSNSDVINVVSEPAEYEVRKATGPQTIIRDGTGTPTDIRVDWGIQVEIKHPTFGQIKGINTANLGDLDITDALLSGTASQLPVQGTGTLVGCQNNTGSSPYVTGSASGIYGDSNSVPDSGDWNCTQAGGTGTDIAMQVTNLDWSPDWFPVGGTLNNAYWSYNSGTNETYNSPSGQNNQAVVATQLLKVSYPYSDVIAFDQTVGDQNNTAGAIRWCNDIDGISNDGGATDIDDPSNNQACVTFQNSTGVGNGNGKRYVANAQTGNGPERELNLLEGALGPSASDNYVAPGQRFGIAQRAFNSSTSVLGLADWVSCDAIDQTKYSLVSHNAAALPGGATGSTHDWYSWYRSGTADPSFAAIGDSDVVVEFSSTGASWANTTAQRTVDCDDGALDWVADPSTHPNGLAAVNLVRVRILEPIAPGISLDVYVSVQADAGLAESTKLINFEQYKTSTLNSGNWVQAGGSCEPANDAWHASSSPYGCASLADRAIVILPAPNTQKSDTPNAGADLVAAVPLGGTWTYTMKSGLSWNHDVEVTDVSVYDVMPPGLTYDSATITPDIVVHDCDAAANFACIATPSARTNIGYTTLRWDRGDFSFDHSGTAETPTSNLTLFANFQVTARVANIIPNGINLQNRAWTDASSGLHALSYPLAFRSTGAAKSDLTSGPLDDDWIQIATAQAFAIEKTIFEEEIPLDGTLKFTLGYGNLSGTTKVMDGIDIFPYNGDGRSPDSVIDGNFSLSSITKLQPSQINQIYITGEAPDTINPDPDDVSNGAVGTGIWSCTYAQIDTPGCPAADEVTAIRIKSNSLAAAAYGFIRLELTTANNDGAEVYTNNWFARATTLALPVMSSDVSAVTPACISIGNMVFIDSNKNGRLDDGEQGIDGVVLELRTAGDDNLPGTDDDIVYKTTSTGAGGFWRIDCIAPGDYFVQVSADNFLPGQPLENYLQAPHGATDPNNDNDQNADHDLIVEDDLFRTNIFTVNYGTGPTGETGSHFDEDINDNLTIDLGFVLAEEIVVPPTVVSTPLGDLSLTGMATLVIQVAGGLMLGISLRTIYKKRQHSH